MKEWFCNVRRNEWGGSIRIYLGFKENDKFYMVRNNKAEEFQPMEVQTQATLEFSDEVQQDTNILTHLVDGLIEAGVNPTVEVPNTNEMTAIKYHLEDMRKLIFSPPKE